MEVHKQFVDVQMAFHLSIYTDIYIIFTFVDAKIVPASCIVALHCLFKEFATETLFSQVYFVWE